MPGLLRILPVAFAAAFALVLPFLPPLLIDRSFDALLDPMRVEHFFPDSPAVVPGPYWFHHTHFTDYLKVAFGYWSFYPDYRGYRSHPLLSALWGLAFLCAIAGILRELRIARRQLAFLSFILSLLSSLLSLGLFSTVFVVNAAIKARLSPESASMFALFSPTHLLFLCSFLLSLPQLAFSLLRLRKSGIPGAAFAIGTPGSFLLVGGLYLLLFMNGTFTEYNAREARRAFERGKADGSATALGAGWFRDSAGSSGSAPYVWTSSWSAFSFSREDLTINEKIPWPPGGGALVSAASQADSGGRLAIASDSGEILLIDGPSRGILARISLVGAVATPSPPPPPVASGEDAPMYAIEDTRACGKVGPSMDEYGNPLGIPEEEDASTPAPEAYEPDRFDSPAVSRLLLSPDCRYILASADDSLFLCDLDRRALWFLGRGAFVDAAFSPDGRTLAVAAKNDALYEGARIRLQAYGLGGESPERLFSLVPRQLAEAYADAGLQDLRLAFDKKGSTLAVLLDTLHHVVLLAVGARSGRSLRSGPELYGLFSGSDEEAAPPDVSGLESREECPLISGTRALP